MASLIPPIPNQPVSNTHEWRDWFFRLGQTTNDGGIVRWGNIVFDGSTITSIQNRPHNSLQGLQGGSLSGTEYYHLSATEYDKLTTTSYGAFQDTTTQTIASTTTAYPITFNTTDYSSNVTMVSGSQITFAVDGLYTIQFSLQFSSLDAASQDAEVWFRKNGVDISSSNSRFGLAPRKNSTDPFHSLGSLNFFVQVVAGDYIQLMWESTSTNVSLTSYGPGTSPTRPSIPCAILTVQQVL